MSYPQPTSSSTTLVNPSSHSETTPLLPHKPSAGRSYSANGFHSDSSSSHGGDCVSEGGEGLKGREVEVYKPGQSTFSQTLLNVLGDLVGTGLLAMPIAVAHAGWLLGGLFLCVIAATTLWTLKILIRIIEKDRRLRSFTDVVGYGLGPNVQRWLTCFFILEFCVWNVALVVLASDSLEAVWPVFTSDQWKLVSLIAIVPTSFVPLRFLSFSSALGVITTWGLIGILLFSGIATEHFPGSLRDPAHTDLWPTHNLAKLGTTFGLIIAGFGGHGLIPNLVHDMKKPRQANRVVDCAYAIAMTVNIIVSVSGYLMFGPNVSDEVSRDLARTPGFSPFLNAMAVWMVALNPLTKLPLSLRPLSDVIFTELNLHPSIYIPISAPTPRYTTARNSPSSSTRSLPQLDPSDLNNSEEALIDTSHPQHDTHDHDSDHSQISQAEAASHVKHERLKSLLRPTIRLALAVMSVLGAMVLPSFEQVMNIMGSGFAVVTAVIIPIMAGASVFGWRWYSVLICVLSGVVGVIGVAVVFVPESRGS